VVIDGGKVRKRKKGPSKQFREKFGHTPLHEHDSRFRTECRGRTMRQILETPKGREHQVEGRVKLVGAINEIETGLVRFLE
jgi:hypothetical protein